MMMSRNNVIEDNFIKRAITPKNSRLKRCVCRGIV